jgi:hypothetical protein
MTSTIAVLGAYRHAIGLPRPAIVVRPGLRRFTVDLADQAGVRVRDDVLDTVYPTYAELSERALLAVSGDEPVDVIVVANLLPEVDPRRAVANQLSDRSGAEPLAFAVFDNGTAAPFTATAILREYLRQGLARRAVLLVLEQASVPYETPEGVALPDRDSAVAVLFGRGAGPSGSASLVAVEITGDVGTVGAGEAAAAALAALPPGPDRTVVVAPPGLAAAGPSTVVRHPPAGLLATAAWWALAEELATADDAARRIVLLDHDPARDQLALAAFDLPGRRGPEST